MAPSRIRIRLWRMARPERGPGMLLWFDPNSEEPVLLTLEPQEKSGVLEYCEGDELSDTCLEPSQVNTSSPQGDLPF